MLAKTLIVLAVLIAAFVVFVAMQPDRFKVVRSARFFAPPAAAFAQVNDFHKWQAWSPWAKRDPQMRQAYEGPSSGIGASYRWAGNKEVGEGAMTIVESLPTERVAIRLEFLKPFAATHVAEFTFAPDGTGDGTTVTWAMTGRKNFMSKAFCLFVDMDKLIGADFENGLAAMKTVAEAEAAPLAAHAAAAR